MLGSNYDRYCLVINSYDKDNKKHITKEMIRSWCDSNKALISFYALIYHDKDTHILNGKEVKKTPHYHLCIELNVHKGDNKILMDIANTLQCNINLISIQPSYEWCKAIRYLTHIDDLDKYQYTGRSIVSNNPFLYEDYFNFIDLKNVDIRLLSHLCITCDTLDEVYNVVGLSNSKKYYWIINNLWDLKSHDRRKRIIKENEVNA